MKTKLSHLNEHLFAQLERLADEGLDADQLDIECRRADAIVQLADQITGTADLQLRAAKLYAEYGGAILPMLPEIGQAKTLPATPDAPK